MLIRIVALKLYHLSYVQLASLGDVINAGFTANPNYTTPVIPLIDYGTALTDLKDAITTWGPKGNHGTHESLLDLRAKRDVLRTMSTQLAEYAESKTPGDRVALGSVGWPLRQVSHTIGRLEAVQNLHQFISRDISAGEIKLKWNKPLNAVNVKINGYRIMRSATNSFAQAVFVANTTKTSFIDTNPGSGVNYYWVVPFNSIDGVVSGDCAASANPVS
jgi:hypothetical protein